MLELLLFFIPLGDGDSNVFLRVADSRGRELSDVSGSGRYSRLEGVWSKRSHCLSGCRMMNVDILLKREKQCLILAPQKGAEVCGGLFCGHRARPIMMHNETPRHKKADTYTMDNWS